MRSARLKSAPHDRYSNRSRFPCAVWVVKRLDELGTVVTGKTPATANPEFYGGDFLFVTPSDMQWNSYYVTETRSTVTERARGSHRNQFIPRDSIVFTCIGNTIGKCGIASADCLTNQQVNSIIVNGDNSPQFVYYALIQNRPMIRAIGLSGGAAQPIINKSTFSSVQIDVPDRATQDEIADILSAYDDLIENNRRRIALLEQAARELYREWFVRLRFPGHESARVVDGLPKGWETKTLGEVADIRGGKQFGGEELDDSHQYPVFGGNGIQGYSSKSTHTGFVIVFGRVGVNCGSIHWSYDGGWVNNNASSIVPRYFNELVLQHLLHYDFSHLRKGAAQPFIPNGLLSTVRLVIPRKELSVQYCNLVLGIRIQQTNLHQQTRDLARARDLLLPRLMSGEVPG